MHPAVVLQQFIDNVNSSSFLSFSMMRFISVLALIFASVTFVTADSLRRPSETFDNSSTRSVNDLEVSVTCDDFPANWVDKVKNPCSWYNTLPNLRCDYAVTFKMNNLTAKDVCCKCGGGKSEDPNDPHPLAGSKYLQSKTYRSFLGVDTNNRVVSTSSNGFRNKIEVIGAGSDPNMYYFKLSSGSYMSVFGANGSVSTYHSAGSWEKFEVVFLDCLTFNCGYLFRSVQRGSYLSVTSSGSVVTVISETEAQAFLVKDATGDLKMEGEGEAETIKE